jgi:hypothetical protein
MGAHHFRFSALIIFIGSHWITWICRLLPSRIQKVIMLFLSIVILLPYPQVSNTLADLGMILLISYGLARTKLSAWFALQRFLFLIILLLNAFRIKPANVILLKQQCLTECGIFCNMRFCGLEEAEE